MSFALHGSGYDTCSEIEHDLFQDLHEHRGTPCQAKEDTSLISLNFVQMFVSLYFQWIAIHPLLNTPSVDECFGKKQQICLCRLFVPRSKES